MAFIKDSNPKKISGGYERIFRNKKLGYLISRVQSAVIRSGNELENIVRSKVNEIKNLKEFLNKERMPEGIFLVDKKGKGKKGLDFSIANPDFIILKRESGKQNCYIVELKDGNNFDTKKSFGERETLKNFVEKNKETLCHYQISFHFCCFNVNTRKEVINAFKSKINESQALTGKEFCELLNLDYEGIIEYRKNKIGEDNLTYFLSELVKIDVVKDWLKKFWNRVV